MLKMAFGLLRCWCRCRSLLGDLHGLNTLRAPTSQDRRDRGQLGYAGAHAVVALRVARRACRVQSLRGRRSQCWARSSSRTTANGVVQGLKDWKPEDRPPVAIPFFAFRLMVGIWRCDARARGLQLVGVAQEAARRRALVPRAVRVGISARFRRGDCRMDHDGGRAPALGGVRPLRTRDAVTPSLGTADVAVSLAVYVVAYLVIFGAGGYFLARLLRGRPGRQATGEWPAAGANTRATTLRSGGRRVTRARPSISFRYGPVSSPSACSCMCCSTASISASASFFRSRPTMPAATSMMNSVAPIWDGNETWLVLGGIALLAAFPLAFAIIMPAVYFPILFMLVGLIFRGVAFEFRHLTHRRYWDHAFHWGSLVATFAQGLVLGTYRAGDSRQRACLCRRQFRLGNAVCAVDRRRPHRRLWPHRRVLAGDEDGRHRCRHGRAPRRPRSPSGSPPSSAHVSIWTPFIQPQIHARWFAWPNLLFLAPVPVITLALFVWLLRSLAGGTRWRAVHRSAWPVRDVLPGTGHQHHSDDRPVHDHVLGRGFLEQVADVPDRRHRLSSCRSSSCTRAGRTGCSAARSRPAAATTSRARARRGAPREARGSTGNCESRQAADARLLNFHSVAIQAANRCFADCVQRRYSSPLSVTSTRSPIRNGGEAVWRIEPQVPLSYLTLIS